MFFKLVAAMVAADAIDRHIRDQRRAATDARVTTAHELAGPPAMTPPRSDKDVEAWIEAPERPS